MAYSVVAKHLGVDDDLDCIGDKNGKCDNDGNDVVDGNDGVGDKMIESVDWNASWDPHVLSCRPTPCKGQGEEEGNGAGHDDEDYYYHDDDNGDDEE